MPNKKMLSLERITFTICVWLTTITMQAQTFNILKEMHSSATLGSISSPNLATLGDKVLFFANDAINGQELWSTDGTAAGTQRLTDILPGAFSGVGATPQSVVGNGVFYFAASDGSELWRSDGTEAGTYLLKNFGGTSRVSQMFWHNGFLLFVANDGINGFEPWVSDGTPAGTVLLKDINQGSVNSLSTTISPYSFIAMGSNVYFAANNGSNGRELWKTDGTNAGTVMVRDVWVGSSGAINNIKAAVHNDKLYFAATDGSSGTELWATDGTNAGTYRVADISPGGGASSPNNLISFNGSLYFSASNNNNNTPGLWRTDGTTAGTVLVKDLAADGITLTVGFNSSTNFFTVNGTKLYFRGGLASGSGLFATDGTTSGTGLVKAVGGAGELTTFRGLLYFQGSGSESVGMNVLYKSDGTPGGTVPVYEGPLLASLSLPLFSPTYTIFNNRLFFVGSDLASGAELWSTDGTSAGTSLLSDINLQRAGTSTTTRTIYGSAFFNGYFLFTASDENHGIELWKTDGTPGGTQMIKDILPGIGSSNPGNFCVVGNQVFFSANNGANGMELWKTDGTEAGTQMVKDIFPGSTNGIVAGRLTASGSYVYFLATHPDYGSEIWRSDGTESGTSLVLELSPGAANGFLNSNTHLTFQNRAFIINTAGNKLYVADGVSNTFSEFSLDIAAAYDMAVVGNTLYIGGRNNVNQNVLWRSENGAPPVQFKVIRNTDGGSSSMYQFTNCNGKLYFNANDGTTGNEPWVSDGTDAGTFRLRDIQVGTGSSLPFHFTASGNTVFFQARTTGVDAELWATDGTEAGTYLVRDINPGTTASSPGAFFPIPGGKVLFTANDGVNGNELWQSDGTEAGTFLVRDFNANGNGMGFPMGLFLHFKENYILWPLNGGVLFFASSLEKGTQLYLGTLPPQDLYVNDNSTMGDVFTTAAGNDNNGGTASSPYATVQHAVNVAPEGSTIYVDAGTYAEQVTITRGITIVGAGRDLTTVIKPAVPLVPPPGAFTEIGLIQTTEGATDVHIRDMTVNSVDGMSHNILIQRGGSVKNSRMLEGSIGVFMRKETGIVDALVEGNIISVRGIGVNMQGTGMNATIVNNTISKPGGMFSGIFAGLDFGPLPQLTISNNLVDSYFGDGMLVNSFNGNYNNNSFTGTGAIAISSFGGNPANAACNWYGTADEAAILAKITPAFVNLQGWLTNGTDAEPDTTGFQPLSGKCTAGPIIITLDTKSDVTCFGTANGSAQVSVSGGTAPYTFVWTKEGDAGFSSMAEDLANVSGGTYTLLVTDDAGNTKMLVVTISEPTLLAANVSGTNVTCFGAANGTATVVASGGTAPYTYQWSNGAATATPTNFAPGTYAVTVTDANGCSAGGSVIITEPLAITVSVSTVNNICATGTSGSITVTAANGTAAYTYSLDGQNFQAGNVFTNLATGSYTVYVQDAAFCIATATATIAAPAPLTIVPTTVTGTCAGTANGAVDVTVSGGTGRYSFAWTGPNGFTSTREDLTRVPAGAYSLVVTDANACTFALNVVVPEIPALTINGSTTPVNCFGGATGAIDITISGGSGTGSTYAWSGPNGFKATTEDIVGLRAGTYTVTVSDAGGCSGSHTVTVTQPAAALALTATKVDIVACDAGGNITITATGGTPIYQYRLNGGALQPGNSFSGLAAGSYTVAVVDANGCTAQVNVTIADNGSDAYEANNTISAAAAIPVGTTIRARLATTKGTDADWFRFITTSAGTYRITWSHPSVVQSFNLNALNRNKAVLQTPSAAGAGFGEYTLAANTTYFIEVSGTQSFACYDLRVEQAPLRLITTAAGTKVNNVESVQITLGATAFPNPHRGSFTLRIESPVNGEGQVSLYDITGRALREQKVLLKKGTNVIRFDGLQPVSLVYRVMADGKWVSGKVIGLD